MTKGTENLLAHYENELKKVDKKVKANWNKVWVCSKKSKGEQVMLELTEREVKIALILIGVAEDTINLGKDDLEIKKKLEDYIIVQALEKQHKESRVK